MVDFHIFHSYEMLDNARNKIRVKAAYLMMALTIGACVLMVVMGKKVSDKAEIHRMHVWLWSGSSMFQDYCDAEEQEFAHVCASQFCRVIMNRLTVK